MILIFSNMQNKDSTPRHIAIIMDGNRRWAKQRGLPSVEGHRKVALEVLETLIEAGADRGVEYMTFWAWSTENWSRKQHEIRGIMKLFRVMIRRQWQKLHEKGVKIRVIGDISKFDEDIQEGLRSVVEQTKNNTKITAVFALNYGGRDEIVRAVNTLRSQKGDDGGDVSKDELGSCLDTKDIPDPEIIVRTGGEQRLSGFLMWQSEYSEFYFPAWSMPEFSPERLDEVIEEYEGRQRRFGK